MYQSHRLREFSAIPPFQRLGLVEQRRPRHREQEGRPLRDCPNYIKNRTFLLGTLVAKYFSTTLKIRVIYLPITPSQIYLSNTPPKCLSISQLPQQGYSRDRLHLGVIKETWGVVSDRNRGSRGSPTEFLFLTFPWKMMRRRVCVGDVSNTIGGKQSTCWSLCIKPLQLLFYDNLFCRVFWELPSS